MFRGRNVLGAKRPVTFVYDPLTWIVSLFLAADLACTAVGLFITLSWQSGTRWYQNNLEILIVVMALNDSWKQFFSAVTASVTIAHYRFCNEMRFTFYTCFLIYKLGLFHPTCFAVVFVQPRWTLLFSSKNSDSTWRWDCSL